MSAWIPKVDAAFGVKVTYGPIGSGGGINAITNRTVDFGASDAPLTPDQFAACKGCAQIPWALSATSLAYRGDGIPDHIKLDGSAVADIFMGRIKKWNDPALKKLNKGKSLPRPRHHRDPPQRQQRHDVQPDRVPERRQPTVEERCRQGRRRQLADGCRCTRISSGVAATLSQTNGGITYVDIAYSLKNHFKVAAVKNRAGVFQLPGLRAIAAAGATILRVAPNNGGISIVNPAKRQPLAYPICTFTYVIVPTSTPKAKELKQFIRWAVTKGQASGPKLLFSPLPKVVLNASIKTLNSVHS